MASGKYSKTQLVAASKYGLKKLKEAIAAGKQDKFNITEILGKWAKTHHINDVGRFIREAKPEFETDVLVTGLVPSSSGSSFSPVVYALFHPTGATGEVCPISHDEVTPHTCNGCYADYCSARYNPSSGRRQLG